MNRDQRTWSNPAGAGQLRVWRGRCPQALQAVLRPRVQSQGQEEARGTSFWGQADLHCAKHTVKQPASKGSELPVPEAKQASIYQGQEKTSGGPAVPKDLGSQGCVLVQPKSAGVILR